MNNVIPLGIRAAPAPGDPFDHLVRFTLAQYLGVEADTLQPSQRLREDIDLETVDIAIVLLRLEDMGRIEFPQASAQLVATVADMTELFRAIFSRRGRYDALPHSSVRCHTDDT
jgi:acyl carrier protein